MRIRAKKARIEYLVRLRWSWNLEAESLDEPIVLKEFSL